jgi:hypothetical protein
MAESTSNLPFYRRHRSTLGLLFSTDYSHFVTTRILKTGYRIVIAIDVFSVLMWVWLCYGLSQVRLIGWFIPLLVAITAVVLGLVWLVFVRVTFEFLLVIFGIAEKTSDLDRKVEYIATTVYHDHNPDTKPANPPDPSEVPDASGDQPPANAPTDGMENAA